MANWFTVDSDIKSIYDRIHTHVCILYVHRYKCIVLTNTYLKIHLHTNTCINLHTHMYISSFATFGSYQVEFAFSFIFDAVEWVSEKYVSYVTTKVTSPSF